MTVAVVGIGHSLRGDDSAGLAVVRAWQHDHPATACHPAVRVEFLESPGIELINAFDGADAVLLVDAVRSGEAAGKLHRLREDQLLDLEGASGSMHGWGIPEAVRLARALGIRAGGCKLRVLGIEAGQIDLGAPLSEAVASIIPVAAAALEDEIRALLAG